MNTQCLKILDEVVNKHGEYLEMVDPPHYDYIVKGALVTEIIKLRDENEYLKIRLNQRCDHEQRISC